jgi:uncharacterized protein (TIGR01732 family)
MGNTTLSSTGNYGGGYTSTATILVLFILLVIVLTSVSL